MFKFTIERASLLSSLLLVSGAVEKRQTLPVLSNVLMKVKGDALYLVGTDTEIQLQAVLKPDSIEEEGILTVPARKFIDLCRALRDGDNLAFSYSQGRVAIKSGRSRFVLAVISAEEFPLIDDEVKDLEFSVDKEAFVSLLQSTYFSMAQQDVRYYLNGLLIEFSKHQIISVSTDGHRLAYGELNIDNELPDSKLILPRKAVLELLRILSDVDDESVLISTSSNHFYLETEQYSFVSKLIDGRFPNHRRVMPKNNDKEILIERDVLKQLLSRVSILAHEKYRAVTLSVSPSKLTVLATNQEQEEAVDEVEIDTQGEPISIGVNANYLQDVLNNVPPGLVKLSFSEPNQSILVESVEKEMAAYVIMPLKI